jgi:hypothetical protein
VKTSPTYLTDKIGHGYGPVYNDLWGRIWGPRKASEGGPVVLEIGTADGHGLHYFQDLFNPRLLIGLDHNTSRQNHYGPMIHASQDDIAAVDELTKVLDDRGIAFCDLIVDDASHDNALTSRTLINMWKFVRPARGIYVIEDWNHARPMCQKLARELPEIVFDSGTNTLSNASRLEYYNGLIVITKMA